MKTMMTSQWWVLLIRGILTLLFGLVAVFYVQFTVLAILVWFVFYAITDGVSTIYMSYSHKANNDRWWLGLLSGAFSLIVGVAAFTWPQLTAYLLLVFIAVRAIFEGIIMVVTAVQLRKEVKGEWLLILGGTVAIIFGLWMLFNPVSGGLALLWIVGMYAIIIGIILIVQAFRLRGLGQSAW